MKEMKVVLGSDKSGQSLKNKIHEFLTEKGYDVIDTSNESHEDFVDATLAVVSKVQEDESNLGIMVDAYGAGSFMVATKVKGMIAAEVSDERSAYMTRGHNNARMITMGSEIVGDELAINIVNAFVTGKYDGGRHQIRVDMLNKMA